MLPVAIRCLPVPPLHASRYVYWTPRPKAQSINSAPKNPIFAALRTASTLSAIPTPNHFLTRPDEKLSAFANPPFPARFIAMMAAVRLECDNGDPMIQGMITGRATPKVPLLKSPKQTSVCLPHLTSESSAECCERMMNPLGWHAHACSALRK